MSDLAERLKKIRNFEKKAGKTFFSQKKHSIQELEYLRKAADCYRDMGIAYAQMSLAFFNRYNFIEKKFRSVESALDRENKPVKIPTDVLEAALEMCGISMTVHDYLKVLESLEVDIEYYKEDLISNIKQLGQSAKTMTWDSWLKQSNINILDITKKLSWNDILKYVGFNFDEMVNQ